MANQKLRVELSTREGMHAGTVVNLRIADALSGEVLADIGFSAEQWVTAMNTSSLIDGFVSNHLERVGREMQVRHVDLTREEVPSYREGEARGQAMVAAQQYVQPGETIEVRNTNSGWVALYRSWPEVTQ